MAVRKPRGARRVVAHPFASLEGDALSVEEQLSFEHVTVVRTGSGETNCFRRSISARTTSTLKKLAAG